MSGRKAQEVIVYNTEGKFITKFKSIAEFRRTVYPDDLGIRPIFVHKELGEKYCYLPELNILAVENRIGRDAVKRIIRIHNCEFCKNEDTLKSKKPIIVLNRKGEIIAEFKTLRLLTKLMPHIPQETIHGNLNNKKYIDKHLINNLIFRYKE